ncbi:MAG: hypothetical protein EBS53_12890, partial [Bacteroidetes bacterium]|nr:hypothetical protein [Bacteroidota bacterium]
MDTRETQIFAKAADTGGYVTIATGITPTERLRVDGSGNVGIGTSSPSQKLEVNGTVRLTDPVAGRDLLIAASTTGSVHRFYSTNTAAGYKFENSSGTLMTLDASGNLGLGVTPSAWGLSGAKAAQVINASFWGYLNNAYVSANNYNDGTGNKYIATGFATRYEQSSGAHSWQIAPSGTAGNAITFTQAMTLDASGNLGIGSTSPSTNLVIGGTASGAGSAGSLGVFLSRGVTTNFYEAYDGTKSMIAGVDSNQSFIKIGAFSNHPLAFVTNNGERARITSGGDLLVGTTSAAYGPSGGRGVIEVYGSTNSLIALRNATANAYLQNSGNDFYINNSGTGFISVSTNGGERAVIDSSGNLLVGSSAAAGKLFALTTGANQDNFFTWADNASYAAASAVLTSSRSANSGYSFLYGISSRASATNPSGQDVEFQLRGDGNGYADGTWNNNGADYAEYFESANGQALTLGATVVLDGNKVREAIAQDPASAVIGVVRPKEPSKASMVVGNTAWNKWANKYLTDDFDRYIMEDHDVVEWTDEDGKKHSYESHNIPEDITVPDDATVKT